MYALSGYKDLNFEVIDVSDPAHEDERNKMSETCKPNAKGVIQPPQFFNDDDYCGVSVATGIHRQPSANWSCKCSVS